VNPGTRVRWTDANVQTAIATVGQHTALAAGLAAVSEALGFEVTRSGIDCALRKSGLGTAFSYLGKSPRPIPPVMHRDTERMPVAPAVELPDDSHTTMPEPDRTFVERPTPIGWTTDKPVERILFIPDCHFPFVDRTAWAIMLECARRFAPHRIIQLGDFVDCLTVSSHSKDTRRLSQLGDEIASANEALDDLDALGAEHRHMTEGNHENRLYRYLCDRAPALLDSVNVETLLRLRERGWTWSRFGKSFQIGNLYVTHSVNGQAGESAHHRAGQRFQRSVVIGHTHRIASKVFGNVAGDRHLAHMFGWLGAELDASYNHDAEKSAMWAHGFGLGWLLPDGTVHAQAVPIIGGQAVVNGDLVGIARSA
jgi:hypothetical protein